MILDFFRRPATRSEVTMPLHEWHAWSIAMDGLVEHNDELQAEVENLKAAATSDIEVLARLTDQRDRARRWAVHLEQENADLEAVNNGLASKLTEHHTVGGCQGCAKAGSGLADVDEVQGVPA
jgi:hypothetical protein